MSMGIIRGGEYDKVAGYSESGELVIGASTIRKGTFVFTKRPDSQFCDATVTFDTPMPDADYEVNISWVTESGISMYGRVQKKTASGFKFEGYYGNATDADTYKNQEVAYTAFKLFTKEGLEDLENDVADLKTDVAGIGTIVEQTFSDYTFIEGSPDQIMGSITLTKGVWVVQGHVRIGGPVAYARSVGISQGSAIWNSSAYQYVPEEGNCGVNVVAIIKITAESQAVNLTGYANGNIEIWSQLSIHAVKVGN